MEAAANVRPNPQHSARRALAVATPEKAHYVSAHVMGQSELFYAVDTTLFSFDLKTQTHNVANESAWQSQPHTGPIRVLLARQDGEEAEDGVALAPTNSDTTSTKEAKKRRVEDTGEAQGEEVKTRIHFATAGDDKMMVFWDEAKKEVARFVHNKKITAAAFVPEDGQKIVFADKFGDVYRLDVGALLHSEGKEATRPGPPVRADKNGENALPLGDEGTPTSPAVGTTTKIITTNAAASSSSAEVGLEKKLAVEPELLFGHLAIVTSMCFVGGKSKKGGQDERGTRGSGHRFLVTADNHEKIRVSHWPRFYDIANFCLAHTGHVTRVVPLPSVVPLSGGKNEHQALFASLGADGAMFVWDAAGDEEHALQSTYSMGSGYLPTELCFFQNVDAEGKGHLVALVHANSLSGDEIQSLGGEGDINSKRSANSASCPRLTFAHGHLLRPDTVCVGHSRGKVYYVDQKNGHVLAAPVGGVGAAAEMAAAKLTVQDLGCPESFTGAAKKERLYKYFKDGEEDN
eukprot:g6517.t1